MDYKKQLNMKMNGTQKVEYGEITRRILDWVEIENGVHPHVSRGKVSYPKHGDIELEYRDISGANSMSHHLPNWRNCSTERKCGRYLEKIEYNPNWESPHYSGDMHKGLVGRYMVKYRKVHPHLEGLKKLCETILKTFRNIQGDGTQTILWNTINDDRARVVNHIEACRRNYNYPITKAILVEYNNLYNEYKKDYQWTTAN